MVRTGIAIFPLGTLLTIVILVIIFVVAKRHKVLGTVIGCLVGLAVACVFIALLRTHRASVPVHTAIDTYNYPTYNYEDPSITSPLVAVQKPRASLPGETDSDNFATPLPAPEQWRPAHELNFSADVYPSASSAARALAQQVTRQLATVTTDQPAPKTIQVFAKGQPPLYNVDPEVVMAAAAGFRQQDESLNVLAESVTPTSRIENTDPAAISVELDWPTQRVSYLDSPGKENQQELAGTLRMQITGQAGSFSHSARFVDKPWLENFAEFISRDTKRNWIVAMSQQTAMSQHEARQQAIRSAATQLAPQVYQKLHNPMIDPQGNMPWENRQWLMQQIENQLSGQKFVTDRFAQSLMTPHAHVWRQAMLVDASDPKISVLAEQCRYQASAMRAGWVRMVLSIAAVVVLTLLVYLFLNAATRGYYVWSLRVVGGLAVIAGILFVMTLS